MTWSLGGNTSCADRGSSGSCGWQALPNLYRWFRRLSSGRLRWAEGFLARCDEASGYDAWQDVSVISEWLSDVVINRNAEVMRDRDRLDKLEWAAERDRQVEEASLPGNPAWPGLCGGALVSEVRPNVEGIVSCVSIAGSG